MINNLLYILLTIVPTYSKSVHAQRATGAPEGMFYIIFTIALVLIVLVSLFLCIKYFVHPGESDSNHIKYRILQDETPKI